MPFNLRICTPGIRQEKRIARGHQMAEEIRSWGRSETDFWIPAIIDLNGFPHPIGRITYIIGKDVRPRLIVRLRIVEVAPIAVCDVVADFIPSCLAAHKAGEAVAIGTIVPNNIAGPRPDLDPFTIAARPISIVVNGIAFDDVVAAVPDINSIIGIVIDGIVPYGHADGRSVQGDTVPGIPAQRGIVGTVIVVVMHRTILDHPVRRFPGINTRQKIIMDMQRVERHVVAVDIDSAACGILDF